jgi:ABC-2 type transport system ATP-binding protein
MTRIGEVISASGIQVDDLGLKRPSLDDVFLHLTGHRAEDEQDDEGSPGLDEGDKTFEEAVR